jgi:hypothetical protein
MLLMPFHWTDASLGSFHSPLLPSSRCLCTLLSLPNIRPKLSEYVDYHFTGPSSTLGELEMWNYQNTRRSGCPGASTVVLKIFQVLTVSVGPVIHSL